VSRDLSTEDLGIAPSELHPAHVVPHRSASKWAKFVGSTLSVRVTLDHERTPRRDPLARVAQGGKDRG